MDILDIKKAIKDLSYSERRELLEMLERSAQSYELTKEIEEARFSAKGIYCPRCGGIDGVVKFGRTPKGQRYRCKDCGRTFTAMSLSLFQGTHKALTVWEKYIECMLDGLSLRKTAEDCGISVKTAFIWRHKILDALAKRSENSSKQLKGVVEADEVFFRVSYKGSRHLPRKAHKRGGSVKKRGLSREQVCVPCAVDRERTAIAKVCNLGKMSTQSLTKFYAGKIEAQSIICTDSEKAYRGFAKQEGFKLYQMPSGKRSNGVYNINHINAYHSLLKSFVRKFRGVSTKYLNNYLVWNNSVKMGIGEVMTEVVKAVYSVRGVDICRRPALPLVG